MQTLLIIVLVLEITFLCLWSYHRRKQNYLLKENGNLRIESDLVREHDTALNQYINLTKTCSSDMEHEMKSLDNLMKNATNKIENQVHNNGDSEEEAKGQIYCEEWMTNEIINHKVNVCKDLGIVAEIDALAFDIEWMQKSDFFSLLYNLFDNAIEACQKVEPEKKRFIRFQLYEEGTYLHLRMENTYQEILLSDGRIMTQKKNKILHGVGLTILESIAHNYSGNVAMTYENHICKTEIRLRKE